MPEPPRDWPRPKSIGTLVLTWPDGRSQSRDIKALDIDTKTKPRTVEFVYCDGGKWERPPAPGVRTVINMYECSGFANVNFKIYGSLII